MALKVAQPEVSAAIDVVKWTAQGDDQEAAAETRKRSRLTGPDCVAFLHYVVKSDSFASPVQRVRAAVTLMEAGGFVASAAKEPTGLFSEDNDHKAS
ncbi:MAG TPA: hypothetical protein VIH81_13415 [Roseiarcus sp.]